MYYVHPRRIFLAANHGPMHFKPGDCDRQLDDQKGAVGGTEGPMSGTEGSLYLHDTLVIVLPALLQKLVGDLFLNYSQGNLRNSVGNSAGILWDFF